MLNKFVVEEFKIDVPWGHLAGKSWGDQSKEIVLVFHGLQDNASSFDSLIPYFPELYCYKVFDLPGHGRSSHFPEGLPIHSIDFVLVYKIIVQYFKQDRYIFIGHSYGSQIAMFFTQLYPQYAKLIVLLDTFYFYPVTQSSFRLYYTNIYDSHLALLEKYKKRSQPVYSYEEALDKVLNGRAFGEVKIEAGKALMERATVQTEDGRYKFTSDQRLKHFVNPQNDMRQLVSLLKKYPVKCPMLVVCGSESRYQYNFFKPAINELKKNKNFVVEIVSGNHNVHMNSPEIVGPIVNKFLISRMNKL